MIIPPSVDKAHRADAIHRQIVSEIARIVEDLEFRRDFLREIWSVSRDRGAFLDTITTRWRALTADDLLDFDPEVVLYMDAFYRSLEDFHLYLMFTDDMPATLVARYDRSLDRLRGLGEELVEALGGDPGRPMVEFTDNTVHGHVRSLFAPPRREPGEADVADEESRAWMEATRDALRTYMRD